MELCGFSLKMACFDGFLGNKWETKLGILLKKNEGLRPLPAPYSLLQFIYICIIIVCVQWRTPMKLWMLTTTALGDLWIQLSEEDRRACPEFWLDYVVRPSKQRLAVVLWTVARGGYDALMENNERGMAGRLDEWIRSNRATWLSRNTFSSANPAHPADMIQFAPSAYTLRKGPLNTRRNMSVNRVLTDST